MRIRIWNRTEVDTLESLPEFTNESIMIFSVTIVAIKRQSKCDQMLFLSMHSRGNRGKR